MAMVLLAVAPAARAAGPTVSITASTFKPAIVVVPLGTTVTWRNDDTAPHAVVGDVASPGPIQPGMTYARRFTAFGDYHYADAANPAKKGTVVVAAAGSSHPPRAPAGHGLVTHLYTGTMTLTVNESYRFYDGKWQSFHGPCNGEVGDGTRNIELRAKLSHAKYSRGFGTEILSDNSAKATLVRYAEKVTAMAAMSSSAEADCGDGTTEQAADVPLDCATNFAGRTLPMSFGWSPSATKNRFQFSNTGHRRFDNCGTEYAGALTLVGIKDSSLPLNLVGSSLVYDLGNTSPATLHEVAAIRAGRALHVTRSIDLSFLTDCCDFWAPHGGVLARIGTQHDVKAKLEIKLRPR
jgi:plastocyanin